MGWPDSMAGGAWLQRLVCCDMTKGQLVDHVAPCGVGQCGNDRVEGEVMLSHMTNYLGIRHARWAKT